MRGLSIVLAAALVAAAPPSARASPAADRAVRLLSAGKPAEAAALLESELSRAPSSAAIATDLGIAYQRLGRRDDAEQLFRRAVQLDPARWYAYANLAALKSARPLSREEEEGLVRLLEAGLSRQPKSTPNGRNGRAGILLALAGVEEAAGGHAAARARIDAARGLLLSAALARRAQSLSQAIDAAEADRARASAIDAWPEPVVETELLRALEQAERELGRDPSTALAESRRLSVLHPGWRAPRWLAARALIAQGRLDDGAAALEALLRLDPLHASAWRLLGETLAQHGGPFEAQRADEALQRALALEPAWSELWEMRARLLLRLGRPQEALRALANVQRELAARGEPLPKPLAALMDAARAQQESAPEERPAAAEPTPAARQLLREAREREGSGDRAAALGLLDRALADSPTLVEAAALRWALGGPVPEETVRALGADSAALVRLALAVQSAALDETLRAAESPEPTEARDAGALLDAGVEARQARDGAAAAWLARPWLERAAGLGNAEARLLRARLRADEGSGAGALEDLAAAVAAGAALEHPDEVQALRARLVPAQEESSEARLARAQLAQGQPAEALASLGGACLGPSAPADARRLVALGVAHDLLGELGLALGCYQEALARAPDDREALVRFSRAAARAPVETLTGSAPTALLLERAARAQVPAAQFARARVLAAAGLTDDALASVDAFLSAPSAPGFVEPGLAEARALQRQLAAAHTSRTTSHRLRLAGALALLALAAVALFLTLLRGLTLEKALLRDPSLYPAVARAVAEVRHDALKHRASALAMLGTAPRAEIARALSGERAASQQVADAYASVVKASRLPLRPLWREPAFGALWRDLRLAEAQLDKPEGPGDARIRAVASRVRARGERLGALLRLGPRTVLDGRTLTDWIRGVEAELRASGAPFTAPALELQGLEVLFPVSADALYALFANLLRNAQAAAARAASSSGAPHLLVRVREGQDAAGRAVAELHVADSSPQPLTLEMIAARESGRGLSLVRDLVREWQGHLRIAAEEAPLCKSVVLCFPREGA